MIFRLAAVALACGCLAGCTGDGDLFSFDSQSARDNAPDYPPSAPDPRTAPPTAPVADLVDSNKAFCRGAARSYAAQQAADGESAAMQARTSDIEFAQCMRLSPYWLSR
jgi:hypothetical protein